MKQKPTYKSKTGNTALQFTGNSLYLTVAVFKLDSGMWHCVEEVDDIDYEITNKEIADMAEIYELKKHNLEDSLFTMSANMI